jgi:Spt5 transcription elongation factor, acidic N-terminal
VQDDDLEDEVELSDDDEPGRDDHEEDDEVDEEDEDGGSEHRKRKKTIKRNRFIDDVADVDDDEEDDDEEYDEEAIPGEKFIEEDGGEVPRDHLAFRRRAMEEEKMMEVEDEEAVNEYYRQKDRQVHYMVRALSTVCEAVRVSAARQLLQSCSLHITATPVAFYPSSGVESNS